MAEDVINTAIKKFELENKVMRYNNVIHSWIKRRYRFYILALYYYGSDQKSIELLIKEDKTLGEFIHPNLPYIKAEIIYAVQNEMCMTD